ncbi:helix-turn-helix transcriptional regulator [Streptomyces thermolilacinus]|uniref:helix-turn-helix transcriptional regulator n=1 Tax=Streptomyces thermolilacinus TaxID=285540 RepID=UPI003406BA1B
MPKIADRVTELPEGRRPLWTMRQIETYYGVSDWTVYQWIKAGMPTVPFPGRQRRFDIDAVQAWMATQTEDDDSPVLVGASA